MPEAPETTPETLHLYRLRGDRIAARDPEDAWKLWEDATGRSREGVQDELIQFADECSVSIIVDRKTGRIESKPAREWATDNGRGVVASTDW